jgi:putative Holliday junction resolvase
VTADRRIGGSADDDRPAAAASVRALPTGGPLLALDVGVRRIGLALSDSDQRIAHPLATLTRRTGRRFPLGQLRPHLETHRPVGIVLGLPLTAEGAEDEWTAEVRDIGKLIAAKTALPVAFWDERMTTARVRAAVRDLGGDARERPGDIDRLAATTLLQHALDARRP